MVVSIHDNGGESFVKVVNQDRGFGKLPDKILVDQWELEHERRSQGADLQQGTDRQKFGNTIATSNSYWRAQCLENHPRTDVSG